MDADSGENAEIEYHVSDDHFAVDASGIVNNNKQLDADNNNAYYEFVLTAKDKGMVVFYKITFNENVFFSFKNNTTLTFFEVQWFPRDSRCLLVSIFGGRGQWLWSAERNSRQKNFSSFLCVKKNLKLYTRRELPHIYYTKK